MYKLKTSKTLIMLILLISLSSLTFISATPIEVRDLPQETKAQGAPQETEVRALSQGTEIGELPRIVSETLKCLDCGECNECVDCKNCSNYEELSEPMEPNCPKCDTGLLNYTYGPWGPWRLISSTNCYQHILCSLQEQRRDLGFKSSAKVTADITEATSNMNIVINIRCNLI